MSDHQTYKTRKDAQRAPAAVRTLIEERQMQRDTTLFTLTDPTWGEAGPTELWQVQELVQEWNAEAIANGDLDESLTDDEKPHIEIHVVSDGDEVRYYRSEDPGDYDVIGIVIE